MVYFPNGTSAEVLAEQCADCPLGYGWNDPNQKELFDRGATPRACPVALVQMEFNYKQHPSGVGCSNTADWLEQLKPEQKPKFVEQSKNETGNVTSHYGSTDSQIETAIEWLRSKDFSEAMNRLINENGICLLRNLLVEMRKEGTNV